LPFSVGSLFDLPLLFFQASFDPTAVVLVDAEESIEFVDYKLPYRFEDGGLEGDQGVIGSED